MKLLVTGLLILNLTTLFSQADSAQFRAESVAFWQDQNSHFTDKKTSPLGKKARKQFAGHQVFPFNPDFVVKANFHRITDGDTIVMKTSADTEKKYIRFAETHFLIGTTACSLQVYQSLALREIEEYKNYLFIPFRDLTSGYSTYGGGRYIDLMIPKGNEIYLNFNLAYNPYCAYTEGYFCPVPPAENSLPAEIKAGAMIPLADQNH